MSSDFSIGVEEEYQLVDVETGDLRGASAAVLAAAHRRMGDSAQPELLRSQVEISTPVCATLEEVAAELARLRLAMGAAAAEKGCRLGAAGTHPFARWGRQSVTDKPRYVDLLDEFQQVARETMIFGCHVHVGIAGHESLIEVMNRMRPWVSVLVALGANSPFWEGVDTGYASYRTEVFRRWPTNGTPQRFGGWDDYMHVVDLLVATGVINDATKLYWDMRPSARFPTLEFRMSDVCLRVTETVALAGLVRGLSRSCFEDARAGRSAPDPRPEVLEAAVWRAARDGLEGRLVDTVAGMLRPAPEMARQALGQARGPLEEWGDWDVVRDGIERLVDEGTGAARQRRAFDRRRELGDVVRLITDETQAGL